MTTDGPLIPGFRDEFVMHLWELYDTGLSIKEVGEQTDTHPSVVELILGKQGLDVLGDARLRANERLDTKLFIRALQGALHEDEQAVFDALAKIGGDEGSVYPRHLPVAGALPHAYPQNGRRRYHPMSERQRRMDKLAPARWRKIVQQNLRRSGLIGR